MHIRFLAHGTGDPQRATDYLMQATDSTGNPRPVVQVLRGNPQMVSAIASGLTTLHRYTSAVIAWEHGDAPSSEDVDAVLDDFEKVAFAGLDPSQYCWAVVSHGGHLHVFVARVELHSGLAMNIAPPGWEKTFDRLRDYWNFKRGWARPDDPRRKRLDRPERGRKGVHPLIKTNDTEALVKIASPEEIKIALGVEPDTKGILREWIYQKVKAGQIRNRAEVVEALKKVSQINRESKNFVSVKVDESKRPMRLAGLLFDENFDSQALNENFGEEGSRTDIKDAPNPIEAERHYIDLQRRVEDRARYNHARYKKRRPMTVDVATDANETVANLTQNILAAEVENDRNRSNNFGEIGEIFQGARRRIQELTVFCRGVVSSVDQSLRISATARQAYRRARKALLEVKKSHATDRAVKSDIPTKIQH